MKSIYRVLETRLNVFQVQRRGVLGGWRFIKGDGWSNQNGAENWIKDAIPRAAVKRRIVSEWFINGEKKPNGK